MKFTIKKELLLDALTKVSKAISTKNLIPVLAGVKFEIKKKNITLEIHGDVKINDLTTKEDINLNKVIFSEFAKENITILEMKKLDATLEDAFMKIIKEGGEK